MAHRKKHHRRKRRVGKGHMRWGNIKAHRRRVAKPKRRRRHRRVGELVNVSHRVKRVGRRRHHRGHRHHRRHRTMGAVPGGLLSTMQRIHRI